ncbi:hypothetical protein C7E18_23610, partial [Stenotrophomonas maltophilia]
AHAFGALFVGGGGLAEFLARNGIQRERRDVARRYFRYERINALMSAHAFGALFVGGGGLAEFLARNGIQRERRDVARR